MTLPSGSRVFLFPRTGNARVANTRRGYAPSPCSQPEARGGERQRARREPAWDGDGGMSAPSSGPFYPLLFTFNAMEVENSEPRPAGEGDVTRTATLRRWSTRLRPKLRELALAVADIAKAISLTLVSKEWGGATLSADKKVIRHHLRAEKSEGKIRNRNYGTFVRLTVLFLENSIELHMYVVIYANQNNT